MSKRPGTVRIRTADGTPLVTVATDEAATGARSAVVNVGTSCAALESAAAVEGLAKHLAHVAAWMRAREQAARVADQFDDVMTRFRDLAMRGS